MNIYCRLSHLSGDVAGTSGTTSLDQTYLRTATEVSREFDRRVGRHFYAKQKTAYLSGNGARRLMLGEDLVSITSLKIGDRADQPVTFDITLAAATDYTLWPRNAAAEGKPYRGIELNPNGQYSAWPVGVDNIQIIALFGYSNESESAGTIAEDLDTSETAITLTNGHTLEAGDTAIVDSEQMSCVSVAGDVATMIRGYNGTTAATHTNGATISVRRYPRDVEEAVKERAIGLRWDTQSGYAGSATLIGDATGAAGTTQVRASYARWRQVCMDYLDPAEVL